MRPGTAIEARAGQGRVVRVVAVARGWTAQKKTGRVIRESVQAAGRVRRKSLSARTRKRERP
jgi:hypothetical protein